MDLKLKIVQGSNAGQEVAVTWQTFLIGRAEDCHLRPGSEMVSRHHCAIMVDQTYVAVRDFGSKNGTYVNNERVVGERELKLGDQLRVGPLQFEIVLRQGELGGKKKPPVHNAKEVAERTAAFQPDEVDVAQFLDDPAEVAPSGVDAQRVAAADTQSIRLTETEQIDLTRLRTLAAAPAEVPSPSHAATPVASAPASVAVASPAAAPAVKTPKRPLPSTFEMPPPEPEPPTPASADNSGRLDKKKVFGKLPAKSKRPEDTRSAASEALDKLRKRR